MKIWIMLLGSLGMWLMLSTSVFAGGTAAPARATLHVMDGAVLGAMPIGAQIAFQSLQGIVNAGPEAEIFLRSQDGDRHDDDWLRLLEEKHGAVTQRQDDYGWYFFNYRDRLDGYLLYDSQNPESINVALSLAGLMAAVPVDVHDGWLVDGLETLGLSRLADVRQRDGAWLVQSPYWEFLNKDGIVQLHPLAGLPNLRDFGVSERMAFFFNDTPRDFEFETMRRMTGDLQPGALVYGWGYTDARLHEDGFIGTASVTNLGTVPSDQAANLSVYRHFDGQTFSAPPLPASPPEETDVHYVTLIMSDGDNVQVMLNLFDHPQQDLYASPRRGEIPIGWTIPPMMAELAPAILESIYAEATPNDHFLAGPSGWAYTFPSVWPDRGLLQQKTEEALGRAGLNSMVSLDLNRNGIGFRSGNMRSLVDSTGVDGVFFSAYDWRDPDAHQILRTEDRPVIPMVRLGYEAPARREIDTLAAYINSLPADPHSAFGYTAVYAHLWTTTVDDLLALEARLDAHVRIVRPDVYTELVRKNVFGIAPETRALQHDSLLYLPALAN